MATVASHYVSQYRNRGGLHIVPTVSVRQKLFDAADMPTDMQNLLWGSMQAASRAMYLWLTGKITPEGDLEQFQRTYKRLSLPTPPSKSQFLLPYQIDPRKLPSDVGADAPHLRDSVRISESKGAMRSSVTHAKEVYWAFFVEFGTRRMEAQPRWIPAAREARQLYVDQTLEMVRQYAKELSFETMWREAEYQAAI